jgi:formylglycine-generating enzyme required for sulfatase activity
LVLVSHADDAADAALVSVETGPTWRLPPEAEWEKAVLGTEGQRFSRGDRFEVLQLNSHDAGTCDMLPSRLFPSGQSP